MMNEQVNDDVLITIMDKLPMQELWRVNRVSTRWRALQPAAFRKRRSLFLVVGKRWNFIQSRYWGGGFWELGMIGLFTNQILQRIFSSSFQGKWKMQLIPSSLPRLYSSTIVRCRLAKMAVPQWITVPS